MDWPRTPSFKVGFLASIASASIALVLALFQVQGWKMPAPLAIFLAVVLFGMIFVTVAMIGIEALKAARSLLEARETSAAAIAKEHPGFLDYEADGLRATNRFTKELNKLSRDTERIGKKLETHSARLGFAAQASVDAFAKQKLANRSAKDINKSAAFIEKRLTLFQKLVMEIERNYTGLVRLLPLETEAAKAEALTFRDTLTSNVSAANDSLGGLVTYRDSVRSLADQNSARTVRIATERLANALEGYVKTQRKFIANTKRISADLDAKLGKAGS
jgi:hypothetical protein